MKNKFWIVIFTCLFLMFGIQEYASRQKKQDIELHGLYDVVRVIDGDTIVVSIDGEDYKVRLIGIDTPESVASEEYLEKTGKENSEEGEIASAYMNELLSHQQVYLEQDIQTTDRYGRLLAYVYLSDGTTMVNRLLLEKGYAQIMTIQPNSKYADEFVELQQQAVAEGVGFWE